jgi:hypothetical protein
MQTIIANIIGASVKLAATGTLTGAMLVAYCESIEYVCPILRAAVQAQERTVRVFEENTRHPENARLVREEWAGKRADALLKIAALEGTAANLRATATEIGDAIGEALP